MKIENLKEGLIVKNYKELCSLLGIKPTGGDSKKAQLKELERFIKYHKEGNKFVVDEIYDHVKEKVDLRCLNDTRVEYNNLNIEDEKFNNIGIYKIYLNADIYIGSTIAGFRKRFQQHNSMSSESPSGTHEFLQNGGVFEILYDMTGIEDDELIRMVETEFINEYLLNPEWNVINKCKSSISYKSKYKKKKKTIKIDEDKLYDAIQLLAKHGLIDKEGVEL